jgi:iron complex outermembrane receptor protein
MSYLFRIPRNKAKITLNSARPPASRAVETTKSILLAGFAWGLCVSDVRAADVATANAGVKPVVHARRGSPKTPKSPQQTAPIVVTPGPEEINVTANRHVTGGGLFVQQTVPKARSEITQEYIKAQAATTSPTSLIASLPGVQSSNEAPLTTGTEELYIRGFDQTQIGFLFEGIPISDPFSYAVWTQAAVDNENIASIDVTQGSTDLNAPLYNADSTQISIHEIRPSQVAGGKIDLAGGNKSLQKEFVRLDSGEVGHSGVYSFLSFSHSAADLQRGPGDLERWHIDASAEKKWTPTSETVFVFGWTQSRQNLFLYPTQAQWNQYGTGYSDNGVYTPGDTKYYKINEKRTNEIFGTFQNKFDLGHGLELNVQPYSFHEEGPNDYAQTVPIAGGYQGTQQYTTLDGYAGRTGTLTVESVHPYQQTTSGLVSVLSWKAGHNLVSFSDWYSYSTHTEPQRNYPVDAYGNWSAADGYLTVNNVPQTAYNINISQQINALALDDKIGLFRDRLTIDAGLKTTMLSRMVTEDLPGASPYKVSPNYFEPTPQVLISYRLTPHDQVFVNGTSSFRAPAGFAAYVPQYTVTTANLATTPTANITPEFLIGEEIGYRHSGPLNVSVTGFHYNLTNHQISSSTYLANSTAPITTQIQAGGETAWGAQAELATRPWHSFSGYASGQYLHTRIDNNVNAGADYLPTTGKSEPGSPHFVGAVGLNYDDAKLFWNFNLRYTDSQYSTLMNDQSMPAYLTADMSIGHVLPSFGTNVHPRVSLNLINLAGNNHLSAVEGYTLNATTRKGVFGKTVTGSQPTYGIGSAFAVIADLSSSF